MKRIIFITICCMMLIGCTKTSQDQICTSDTTTPSSYQGYDYDAYQSFTFAESFDEYEEFCDSGKVAGQEEFVYYEQIAEIGAFYECIIVGIQDGTEYTCSWCSYTLKDSLDRSFEVGFSFYAHEIPAIETLRISPEDMRRTLDQHSEGTVFQQDGLIYQYDALGELEKICWDENEIYFSLRVEGGFGTFEPNPEGTFVERMLCLESAPAAVEEFAQMISTPYTPEDEVVS